MGCISFFASRQCTIMYDRCTIQCTSHYLPFFYQEAARFDDLDLSKSSLKRSHVRSLSPITSKYTPYHSHPHKNQSIRGGPETMSPNITPSLLINSTESVAKSMTSSQLYNWEPRPPFDWGISSPSLIRPAGFTPPRTRKHHSSHTTEVFALSYSNRMKDDKLFDKQRWGI